MLNLIGSIYIPSVKATFYITWLAGTSDYFEPDYYSTRYNSEFDTIYDINADVIFLFTFYND